jgi:uncharacterized membrane protein
MTNIELAALRAEVAGLKADIDRLDARIDSLTVVAAQLSLTMARNAAVHATVPGMAEQIAQAEALLAAITTRGSD